MEFHEKLQQLRKHKGLTQEELAQALFVSRTAISKWESGRGYPSIDSLKALAAFYRVTIDDLLSGSELLTIAEEDSRHREKHLREAVFGLLDLSLAMFFFLPFFGQKGEGVIHAVSLPALSGISPWLRAAYFIVVAGMIASGVATLALQAWRPVFWDRIKLRASCALNAVGVLLFTISLQPYAAVFLFFFLAIKVFMLIKWP